MSKISLIDKNKKTFNFKKNEIYILDFWTTNCSICFKDFPKFNTLCKKYNDKANFYSVNVPLKRDSFEKSLKIIDRKEYSFNHLFASSVQEINDKLKINAFPTIIIVKNNKIVYQGHPSYDKNVIINNFEKEIERVLK